MEKRLLTALLTLVLVCSLCLAPAVSVSSAYAPYDDTYLGNGVLKLTSSGTPTWTAWQSGISSWSSYTNYTISFWVKGTPGVSTSFRVLNNMKWGDKKVEQIVTATDTWTQHSFDFNSGSLQNPTYVFMDGSEVAGDMYIDEVVIKRTDGAASNTAMKNGSFDTAGNSNAYGGIIAFENHITVMQGEERIDKLAPGTLTVSMDFANKEGAYPNGFMVLALYQGNILKNVGVGQCTGIAIEAHTTLTADINVDAVDENTQLKVMLWDSGDNISPSCDTYTVVDSVGILQNLGFRAIPEEPPPPPVSKTYRRGVNISGAEFGNVANDATKGLGTGYTYNNEATFKYFGEKGLDLLRIPIRWARIQPTLGGALNTQNLNALKQNAAWAKKYGAQIIIDVHDYGGRNGYKIGETSNLTREHFADLWTRLSTEFKNDDGVYGYDLMNEPAGISSELWKAASQSAVTAIRNNGDNKLIYVEGVSYSNAHGWESKNDAKSGGWITDPANNFTYSAHCYFDSDNSGTYPKSAENGTTYDYELSLNKNLNTVGVTRVNDFIKWCNKFGFRGHLGEFGVPKDDIRWNTVLENFMAALDDARMDATYWSAGTWWGGYSLSVQPSGGTDAQQMSVLLLHKSKYTLD